MVKMMLTRAPDPDRWARERGHPILRKPVLAHDSREWREAAEQKELLLLPTSRNTSESPRVSRGPRSVSVDLTQDGPADSGVRLGVHSPRTVEHFS